jgi:hypothetical protein
MTSTKACKFGNRCRDQKKCKFSHTSTFSRAGAQTSRNVRKPQYVNVSVGDKTLKLNVFGSKAKPENGDVKLSRKLKLLVYNDGEKNGVFAVETMTRERTLKLSDVDGKDQLHKIAQAAVDVSFIGHNHQKYLEKFLPVSNLTVKNSEGDALDGFMTSRNIAWMS